MLWCWSWLIMLVQFSVAMSSAYMYKSTCVCLFCLFVRWILGRFGFGFQFCAHKYLLKPFCGCVGDFHNTGFNVIIHSLVNAIFVIDFWFLFYYDFGIFIWFSSLIIQFWLVGITSLKSSLSYGDLWVIDSYLKNYKDLC
jgi:hypothetical protein